MKLINEADQCGTRCFFPPVKHLDEAKDNVQDEHHEVFSPVKLADEVEGNAEDGHRKFSSPLKLKDDV